MAGAKTYPLADTRSQWYQDLDSYAGSIMPHPNVVVLHTTEGSSWPGYGGGASAPTLTAYPDVKARKLIWRQHFPLDRSARALRNASGGVETNTLNVIQVELIGTCDEDGPGMYWPDAPDWALKGVADFLKWVSREWPVPLRSTSKPWLPYPRSFGSRSGQRMSHREWADFTGICGHQHVPENDHGDPGAFPIKRVLAFAKGEDSTPPKPATRAVVVKAGQTLGIIAASVGLSVAAILGLNPQIKNPNLIYPGDKVKVPAQSPTPKVSPKPTAKPTKSVSPKPKSSAKPKDTC
ncbi:LysM peptidoglycan-binding domain-containing protein [Streptomyces sp. SP17KL33]|uniref:LysM peptidoglycan-binding domain-containing protein n=1 Tax=Streptomyces sp. SP17KL33 TaxID=3002534 RepID=UPI002E78D50F|nr:LysM peptidoglycan-binding domain-containing protein [Streptomyces sp. SP17KL33]MEE1835766.1 LysM peptidoglycan-binding domain-containing protein [Streptomyces sp. SP17KL33]